MVRRRRILLLLSGIWIRSSLRLSRLSRKYRVMVSSTRRIRVRFVKTSWLSRILVVLIWPSRGVEFGALDKKKGNPLRSPYKWNGSVRLSPRNSMITILRRRKRASPLSMATRLFISIVRTRLRLVVGLIIVLTRELTRLCRLRGSPLTTLILTIGISRGSLVVRGTRPRRMVPFIWGSFARMYSGRPVPLKRSRILP